MRARSAAVLAAVVLAFFAGCGDDQVAITDEARNDLDGRMEGIGLAIAAGETAQATEALDELVSQAERYAEDGQIEDERLAAIVTAAEELEARLGSQVETVPSTTEFPAPPTTEAPAPPVQQGDGGEDDEGGQGNGQGNGRGDGRGGGDDD